MEKAITILPQPGNRVCRDQLVTLSDLQELKEDLLLSIKTIILNNNSQQGKRWLKSYEVKKLLSISTGTLQNLRANGSLPFSKMGGLTSIRGCSGHWMGHAYYKGLVTYRSPEKLSKSF